jgi:N4-gp56 family major capsid protein
MVINKSGDISQRTAVLASARLLRVGQPLLTTQRFGQAEDQAKKSGKIRVWRRYNNLPLTSAPMAEGITPPGQQITYTDYQAVLQQYGDVVYITDVIEDTHEDPVLKEMMARCGEQMAQIIEMVTIDVIKAGTNVVYAGGVTLRTSVTATVSRGDLRKIVRGFNRSNASPISRIISPTQNESTSGVEPGFYAMGHTDLESDIRNVSGFKTVVEYANPGQALPGECGAIEKIRFILTSLWKPWLAAGGNTSSADGANARLSSGTAPGSGAVACDIYPMVVVARDAYAVVRLQGMGSVNVSVLHPKPAASDPLGQRGSVGWKTWYAAAILNELWLCRY